MKKNETPDQKKMRKLCKALDFENQEQYFDYCIESHVNGNFEQCRELFKDMPRIYKHELLGYIYDRHGYKEIHKFYQSLF